MRTVALYGNSLVLATIRASLEGRTGLQVLAVDAVQPGAAERLRALQADVIVFDVTSAQPDFTITLWKAQPHVLLIGVDLTTDRALVLSGQSSLLLTGDDLVQVIESQTLRRIEP